MRNTRNRYRMCTVVAIVALLLLIISGALPRPAFANTVLFSNAKLLTIVSATPVAADRRHRRVCVAHI